MKTIKVALLSLAIFCVGSSFAQATAAKKTQTAKLIDALEAFDKLEKVMSQDYWLDLQKKINLLNTKLNTLALLEKNLEGARSEREKINQQEKIYKTEQEIYTQYFDLTETILTTFADLTPFLKTADFTLPIPTEFIRNALAKVGVRQDIFGEAGKSVANGARFADQILKNFGKVNTIIKKNVNENVQEDLDDVALALKQLEQEMQSE